MTSQTLTERAPPPGGDINPIGRSDRLLGHPLAFLATPLILLAVFSWTFVSNPERVAPTKDPAYYTWRTETIISEDPETLLNIEGPFEMFSGGYRVGASVIGGFLRRVPEISTLNTTVILMVAVPVLTALLLAGFAYRKRKDPLIFHSVAVAVASLYLTPPFVGYLDNILCLLFLSAAVWFIGPARASWPGRAGLFLFLLLAGFTHPTTLVIFCVTLGAISLVRLLFRKLDLRSVLRDDGPMLFTAFAAAVAVFAVWTIGIWGRSASLTEAALPPPYDSSFFIARMNLWIDAMRPLLNGPLFAAGVVGLLAAGRSWVEDDLATVSIVWLAPLAGLFGFIGGLTYPYYRFFNTTVAWVLLVGLGSYFAIRLFIQAAARGGAGLLGLAGVLAVVVILVTNMADGLDKAGWNDPDKGWLSAEEREDLDALRGALTGENRPVVFVTDTNEDSFQVWGETKLAGNTSRYGLPPGQIDQGYLYLGSLQNFMQGRPTLRGGGAVPAGECGADELGKDTYNCLSKALLADTQAGIERAGTNPVVVVAGIFNETGANVDEATRQRPLGTPLGGNTEVLAVSRGEVTPLQGAAGSSSTANPGFGASPLHLLRVLAGFLLMLVPGAVALRWFLPGATLAEALGMAPALSVALLSVAGMAILAVVRSPFSPALAWGGLGICALAATMTAIFGHSGSLLLRREKPATAS